MNTMPADYRLDSNETQTLANAVERSRERDEIVSLEWDSQAVDLAAEELLASHDGEDSATNGDVTECWGAGWRVHLRAVEGLADW